MCDGIQITKTAMLTKVMMIAVPHFSLKTVDRCSAMIEIRLTIICISNWTSKTQQKRMKKRTGTLSDFVSSTYRISPVTAMSYVGPISPSRKTHPITVMTRLAAISPQSM